MVKVNWQVICLFYGEFLQVVINRSDKYLTSSALLHVHELVSTVDLGLIFLDFSFQVLMQRVRPLASVQKYIYILISVHLQHKMDNEVHGSKLSPLGSFSSR